MFRHIKITLTVVLVLSFLGGVPLPSHQFSPIHQAQAGPLKWTAKKAIGGLIKIAVIKIGTKAGKEASSDLPGLGGIVSKSGRLLPKSLTTKQLRNKAGSAYGTKGLRYIKDGDKWLRGSHGNAGNIPKQVDEFRAAFWMEVSKDSHLSNSFKSSDYYRMKNGNEKLSITP